MHLVHIAPTAENIDHISALYCACFNAPDKGEDWTMDSARQYFKARLDEGSVFYGLYDDNVLIGVCCGGPYSNSFIAKEISANNKNGFYISLIAIDDAHQGKGVGSRILSQFCDVIHDKGFAHITIRCRTSNTPMRSVISKNGFMETKTYTSELGGVTCERVISEKTL